MKGRNSLKGTDDGSQQFAGNPIHIYRHPYVYIYIFIYIGNHAMLHVTSESVTLIPLCCSLAIRSSIYIYICVNGGFFHRPKLIPAQHPLHKNKPSENPCKKHDGVKFAVIHVYILSHHCSSE
jgi:hypothetical protein